MAGRSLGELVRKLGDRVLPTVVPLLQAQLTTVNTSGAGMGAGSGYAGGEGDEAEAMRQGVCLGLVEILAAASKAQVETYIGTLVPALQVHDDQPTDRSIDQLIDKPIDKPIDKLID